MNVLDEIKGIVEININEDLLCDKLFDRAVDPLMLKLVGLIPTEIDNAFYASKKEELRVLFKSLVAAEVQKVEDKVDAVLDEQPAE